MSTYLCIQCAQTFTLEHHFAGSLFEDMLIEMRQKGFLGALTSGSTTSIFVANVKLDFLRPIKPSSLKLKKAEIFMQGFRDKRMMGHVLPTLRFKT